MYRIGSGNRPFPDEVRVHGCTTMPCTVRRGNNALMDLDFTTPLAAHRPYLQQYWEQQLNIRYPTICKTLAITSARIVVHWLLVQKPHTVLYLL